MAYTTIDKPSDYFETITYAGTGSSNAITELDFQPDWVWIKSRTAAEAHRLHDSVRGANKLLRTHGTFAEATTSQDVMSFDSNGFTVGTETAVNNSGQNIVSWNWKAGTAFTNDASATGIGSIDSAGSVNTDAGFSIMTYTGTGSNATFAHGLGAVPKMAIFKDRSSTGYWMTYHQAVGNGANLVLNTTDAKSDSAVWWNSTSPTSSVFSIGTSTNINVSGRNYVGYLFAEKQGYSKFGSYTGNGNVDGTFVYTGMKPTWLMIKKSSASGSGWMIFDTKRNPTNDGATLRLPANGTESEATDHILDILSNGFKIRDSDATLNTSGATFIYMAFAESPFVTSTGVPATAR